MRISTSSFFNANVAQLDTLTSNLNQTQQQISTGLRIVTPADDPAGAALALQITQTDATNTQYLSNIGAAQNATNLAEGALQSVTTLMTSMQTTVVQAGSSALSNADRATLASTLQSDLSQLMGLANSTDATGNYLFSGSKGSTQPFIQTAAGVQYNGNDGQQMVQVSSNQQLATSDSGANIFMRIKNGNGTFAVGTSQTIAVAGTNVMAGATGALFNFNATPTTFTVDGTNVTVNQNVTVAGTGSGPGTLTAAIQAGLDAAGLTSYSVSAAAGGGLQIVHTGSTAAVVIAGTDANANSEGIVNSLGTTGTAATSTLNTGTGIISQGSLANPPPTAAQQGNSYQITFSVVGGVTTYSVTGTDLTGAALPTGAQPAALPTAQAYTSGQNISFNGIQFNISGAPANGDTFTVQPSTNESVFTTIQNLINTLNTPVSAANPASAAQLSAGINTAINNLSNALNSVSTAEASQGTRLNQMSVLTTTGNNLSVQYKSTLSTIQDLDYNKALSDYSQQQTILKAAQQSFVQVEGLSMFNYMR
jgi:flagellar hook-associated protein 3 FlgL